MRGVTSYCSRILLRLWSVEITVRMLVGQRWLEVHGGGGKALFGTSCAVVAKYGRDFDVPEKSDLFVDGVDASSSMQMLPPASAKISQSTKHT